MTYNKYDIREFLLYLLIFFPYFKTFVLHIDTAPYALIYSSWILLFIKNIKLPKELIYLLMLFISSIAILFASGVDYFSIRITAGYFSIFAVAAATYYVLKRQNKVNVRLIYIFTLIWFFIGLVQVFIDPSFLTSLISRSNTTIGRGVTGLAPEPTYYATVSIFLFFISYVVNYKVKQIFILSFIMTLIFAKSATVLLIYFLVFIIYMVIFISNKSSWVSIFLILIGALILSFNFDLFQGTRFYKLSLLALGDPILMLTHDASGNARFWNIIGSFFASYDNYFLPNLYGTFKENFSIVLNRFPDYVNPYTLSIMSDKIMSGTGQMLYNLGFISLLYVYSLYRLARKHFKNIKSAIFLTFSIFIVMTTAIPLTFPMFGFIYGLLAFYAYQNIRPPA